MTLLLNTLWSVLPAQTLIFFVFTNISCTGRRLGLEIPLRDSSVPRPDENESPHARQTPISGPDVVTETTSTGTDESHQTGSVEISILDYYACKRTTVR